MDPDVPMQRTPPPSDVVAGRVPPAVVVVDVDGLVSHWSSGARRLFGVTRQAAVGSPADELLPIYGVLSRMKGDGTGFGPELDGAPGRAFSCPMAGRARVDTPERGRIDVLWWAYPLVRPGAERLLVLAADAGRLGECGRGDGRRARTVAPAFAPHTDFPGYREPMGRLPGTVPGTSVGEVTGIVAQVLEHVDPREAFRIWYEECARSRAAVEAAESLDITGSCGDEVLLRGILTRMIEEYARHNGPADLRERIDGVTGE
ncbi:mycothiol transferase [Streptomyces gelaticus]